LCRRAAHSAPSTATDDRFALDRRLLPAPREMPVGRRPVEIASQTGFVNGFCLKWGTPAPGISWACIFALSLLHRLATFVFNAASTIQRRWGMVVKTNCNGREITGVEIGAGNVRRYFPKGSAFIELLLDHLQIQCGLAPDFWQGQTEIRDPRLRAWLESKNFKARPGEAPVPLVLIPSGKNCFRLQTIRAHVRPHVRPEFKPAIPA
jgi:hypothetical protein